jgi:hypothetical protein
MDTHAAAMCGYCGASARIKFDGEQFAALFNELQARGNKTKLMQLVWSLKRHNLLSVHFLCSNSDRKRSQLILSADFHVAQRS